jgi:hypothetical protein
MIFLGANANAAWGIEACADHPDLIVLDELWAATEFAYQIDTIDDPLYMFVFSIIASTFLRRNQPVKLLLTQFSVQMLKFGFIKDKQIQLLIQVLFSSW